MNRNICIVKCKQYPMWKIDVTIKSGMLCADINWKRHHSFTVLMAQFMSLVSINKAIKICRVAISKFKVNQTTTST